MKKTYDFIKKIDPKNLFVVNYGVWKRIADEFPLIDDDTKASLILEKLNEIEDKFKSDYNTKITTYGYRVIKNMLLNENRRSNDFEEDIDEMTHLSLEPSIIWDVKFTRGEEIILYFLLNTSLTQKEIADTLNVSQSKISRIIKKIRIKVQKGVYNII